MSAFRRRAILGLALLLILPVAAQAQATHTRTASRQVALGMQRALASALAAAGQRVTIDNIGRVAIFDGTDTANVTAGGKLEVTCDNCGGGTSDTDDGTIATGQSGGLSFALNMYFDGANWVRWDKHIICDSGCAAGAPGQTTMASSSPVVIASDQSAVPVSGPLTDTQLRATPIPVSGTVTVTDGAGTLNVIVDSGSTVVTQPTGTDLHAVIDSGAVTVSDGAGALNTIVDSGTLTAVTSITNSVTVTDGAGALNVIVDSATLGTVTVSDGAGAMNTIVDSGSITANAGTNLNTSLLALEAGGNLAAIRTAVETIDNFISGARGLVTEDNSASILAAENTLAALSKAEDAVHASGATGVQMLGVRNDAALALTSDDGDYSPIAVDSHGHAFERLVGQQNGTENQAVVSPTGALRVTLVATPALPLLTCNAVRRSNCSPKGF